MERLKILIFRIGDRHFALPSKSVKEILDSSGSLKPVFYGGGALKGMMNFGGEVVSVLNASVILDITDNAGGPMILVCKEREMEKVVGIAISEVREMQLLQISGINQSVETDPPYVSGLIGETDENSGKVVTLLDLNRFLDFAFTKIDRL
ncbi:MAG: chemotaxis protein CheW [Deltaproteobacteria bacterium]